MPENKGYIVSTVDKGSINISEEVIAVIAAVAAAEVQGVHGQFIAMNKDVPNILGRKGVPKGIKLLVEGDDVTIDINIIIELGFSVSDVGEQVQKAVISAIQDAAGITVAAVNVHVGGVALKKKEK